MKLKWTLSYTDELVHVDKKYGLKLVLNKNKGIFASLQYSKEVELDYSLAVKVLACEPKLLKKGMIAFMDEDSNPISQPAGDFNIPLAFEFAKKDSDMFWLMLSVLRENGFEMLYE